MIKYACIKNNVVDNVILFEEFNEELFNLVIQEKGYDSLVEAPEDVRIGYFYENSNFVSNLTYVNVPNVIGMTVAEATTLLEGLTLQVESSQNIEPKIVSISISSNQLTVETIEKNYAKANESVVISSLENEDLNGTYQVISVLDDNKFVVSKNAADLEETQVPFGKVTMVDSAGKVCYQSILEGESGILEDAPIIITAFAG